MCQFVSKLAASSGSCQQDLSDFLQLRDNSALTQHTSPIVLTVFLHWN